MVGGGNRRDDTLVINSTNVFAVPGALRKKKSDKEQGSSKAGKSTSKDKQEKDKDEIQVFWATAPLTAKSWADVDDEDDDDYYATNAPIHAVWGAADDQADKAKESSTPLEDEKDCADQMANLATCIPYVSGSAKKPTPECCEDTKKVREAKPKCLCVLIKESTDTSMGLPINTTLALQMPSACNIDAKVSDCPSILNIPADSPDAKIFKEADGSSSATSSTPSSTSSSSSTTMPSTAPTGSGSSAETKTTTSNNSGAKLSGFLLVIMALSSTALINI